MEAMVSITDELREYARRYKNSHDAWSGIGDDLDQIADRIDVTHRSALEKLAVQLDETSDMREFCVRLEEAATNREDVTLWGADYTALPVDADGVPIHVGDVMEVKFDTKRRPFTVSFVGERAVAFWVVGQPDLKSFNLDTVLVTHHHKPTVEDVLREFAREIDADAYGITDAKVAEYAARLRLAGSDAE